MISASHNFIQLERLTQILYTTDDGHLILPAFYRQRASSIPSRGWDSAEQRRQSDGGTVSGGERLGSPLAGMVYAPLQFLQGEIHSSHW